MIVVRFKGGFGNQLFQYAAGRALAARHNVPLGFDTRWYDRPDHQRLVRRSFDLMYFAIRGQAAGPAHLWPYFFNGNHRRSVRLAANMIRPLFGRDIWIDDRMGFAREFAHLGRKVLLEGYFQDPRYFDAVQTQLREEFQLRSPPAGRIIDYATALSAQPSVCIQVRRTDFLTNPQAAAIHGTCKLEYFKEAWSYINAHVPAAKGFVFTDDPRWAHDAFQGWPGVSVVDPAWDGPAYMHRFYLMRSCRHFIIANSTWGWWAAWLGRFPGKMVVLPEQWSLDRLLNEASAGLCLPGWVRC